MTPTTMTDSIFFHPSLAGTTLMVRQGPSLTAFAIRADGTSARSKTPPQDLADLAWRGAPSR